MADTQNNVAEGTKKYSACGPTFIGVNSIRSQYIGIRWQIIATTLGINTIGTSALASLILGLTTIDQKNIIVSIIVLTSVMTIINASLAGFFVRTSQYINYFTHRLKKLEESSQDELFPIYSDDNFPGNATVPSDAGRVSLLYNFIATRITLIWFVSLVLTIGKVILAFGQEYIRTKCGV